MSDNRNPTLTMQIDGACLHTFSLVHPVPPPADITNLMDDPKFVNEAMGDLHLQSSSPARGKAAPGTDLSGVAAFDMDGDARMTPADLGADQVKP